MAWRALCQMQGNLQRTWQRRCAAGVAESYVDPATSQFMVWIGWPGQAHDCPEGRRLA